MTNIVLLGAPGAGKDTLADNLKEKQDYYIITPGAIFREEAERETPFGLKARNEYWGKGKLCPDEITNPLVKSAVGRLRRNVINNIVFNGYPRTLIQAQYLEEYSPVDTVINLVVDKEVAIGRLLSRGREDDTEEVIAQRFVEYTKNNHPIEDFYRSMNYIEIDANESINHVYDAMLFNLG